MFRVDSHEAAFPGAKQGGYADQERIDESRNHMIAEGFRVQQQAGASQPDHKPERGANESVTHDIQGFEVIAGMDLMALEARLVAADDVQIEIHDADLMQIGRYLIGRSDGASQIIKALQSFPRDIMNGGP